MNGGVQVLNCIIIFFITLFIISIFNIHTTLNNEFKKQNIKDAHMLSIIGMYVDVMDEVSWANKQLERLALLNAAVVFVPELAPFMKYVELICVGLEKYQNILLKKIKIQAPIVDLNLRRKNKISLLINSHYLTYRRRMSIDLGFIKIPGLIEFNKSIYKTVCVKHSGLFINSIFCLDNKNYKNREWFAPTKSNWGVKFAY